MNAEPPGFDRAALYAALREWELSVTSLSYLPLGAGSQRYLERDAAGTRLFVTVDVLEWELYGMLGPTFDPWMTPDLESGLESLQAPHVGDPDARHLWTMLQSLLSQVGESCSWRRR
jgi:hypothetical protein